MVARVESFSFVLLSKTQFSVNQNDLYVMNKV